MMIGPIIFSTVMCGINAPSELRKVVRVGLKAILYFEVITKMALLLGVYRFMSEAWPATNLIGNGVATIFLAHSERALDHGQARCTLDTPAEHDLGG